MELNVTCLKCLHETFLLLDNLFLIRQPKYVFKMLHPVNAVLFLLVFWLNVQR